MREPVYLLYRYRDGGDVGNEGREFQLFGLYATKEQAENATQRWSNVDGNVYSFGISRYWVDEDNWSEGFIEG